MPDDVERTGWSRATVREIVDPARPVTYGIVQPGPRQSSGVSIIRGQDYSSGEVSTEGLYQVHPSIAAAYRRSTVTAGDILLSIVGYVGLTAQVPKELTGANLTQTTARIAIRADLSSRFFLHFFRGNAFKTEVSRYTKGSAQPGLNLGDVDRFRVVCPRLPEQSRIAEILDTLDEAIRKTEQVIAKLQQVKQGLLHDLLTRGIDENGELRDPERHPERFKHSPLGRVPKQWSVQPLRDAVAFITDYRGKTPPYVREGVAAISAENIGGGRVKRITKCVTPEVYRRWSTRGYPEPGDTIFTTEAPVAQIARLPGDQTYLLTRRLIALRPVPQVQKSYLYWAIVRLASIGAWSGKMHGSTVPRILKPDILSQPLARPPLAEQERISARLDGFLERLDGEQEEVQKLRILKLGLMDDLLMGRVRVSVPEAATV